VCVCGGGGGMGKNVASRRKGKMIAPMVCTAHTPKKVSFLSTVAPAVVFTWKAEQL
jgi:hypothetical protein